MKKLVKLLTILLTLIFFVAGCNNVKAPAKKPLSLIENGVSQFVIYQKNTSEYPYIITIQNRLQAVTGVEFQSSKTQGKNNVYLFSDYNKLVKDGERCYNDGYGIVFSGGDIHLCAYNATALNECIDEFIDIIAQGRGFEVEFGEEGAVKNMVFKGDYTYLKNPSVIYSDAKINGKSLIDFNVVISQSSNVVERFNVNQMVGVIADQTGYSLNVITDDKPVGENEIVIGKTNRLSEYKNLGKNEYNVCYKNGSIYAEYGSFLAFEKMQNSIFRYYQTQTVEEFSGAEEDTYKVEKGNAVRVISSNVVNRDAENSKAYVYNYQTRVQFMAEAYSLFNADFLGLQETDIYMQAILMQEIDEKYKILTYPQTPTNNFTPILYDSEKWQVITSECENPEENTMCRYQWGLFSLKSDSNKKVIVMNHHNHPNSNMQAPYSVAINEKLVELINTYKNVPIILTGDYNAYCKQDGTFDTISYGVDMKSSMVLTNDNNSSVGSTHKLGMHGTESGIIDHVGVIASRCTVISHRILRFDLMKHTSDHYPVFADLNI